MSSEPQSDLALIVGGLTALLTLVGGVLQLFERQSSLSRMRQELELLKLKCEIEPLRKTNNLAIPSALSSQDAEALSRISLLGAGGMRETFWLRLLNGKPKLALFSSLIFVFLSFVCVGGAVAMGFVISSQNPETPENVILALVLSVDLILGPTFAWHSIRTFRIYRILEQDKRGGQGSSDTSTTAGKRATIEGP